MFENVIVGVDGRPAGRDAIELARHLVDRQGKLTLTNVHSGELSPVHAVTPGLLTGEREASHELLVRERVEAELDAGTELVSFVALSPGRGLHDLAEDVEGRAVYGLPGEELAAFSADVNLLVVGSRNYGPLRRLVVGSTSDYLERHARCSLLALPRRAGAQAPAADR